MQTILGGGGTIGVALAKELAAYTNQIRIAARNPQKVNINDELVKANLTIKEEVYKAVEGSEIAYLTVGLAYNTKAWESQWPVIMQNVVDACQHHNTKLVFFDNIYMYDPHFLNGMTEITPINPSSKKGRVRAKIAKMLLDAMADGRVKGLIARAADFYGPNIKNSIVTETIVNNFLKGKKAQWMGDASKLHSFTYTPDAAKATALLGNTESAYNQVWHLPTHKEKLTGEDWIKLTANEMGVVPRFQQVSPLMLKIAGIIVPILKEFADIADQYTNSYYFDSSKFSNQFHTYATEPKIAVKEIVSALSSR